MSTSAGEETKRFPFKKRPRPSSIIFFIFLSRQLHKFKDLVPSSKIIFPPESFSEIGLSNPAEVKAAALKLDKFGFSGVFS